MKLKLLFVLAVAAFLIFSLVRVIPSNSALEINNPQIYGNHDRKVYKVFDTAQLNANQDLFEDFDNAVYFGRNPALFLLNAELGIRMGLDSPLFLQLTSLFMFTVGVFFYFYWVKELFGKKVAYISSLVLLTSRYLLFQSLSIHADPYEFLFFNGMIASYITYHKSSPRETRLGFAILTAAALFILTQNYYMFYFSSYIFLVTIGYYFQNKIFTKQNLLLAIVPIFSFALVITQLSIANSSISEGATTLADIAAARTVDARIPDSEWFPDQKFVGAAEFAQAPNVISKRIQDLFRISLPNILLLFGLGLIAKLQVSRVERKELALVLGLVAAGMSWFTLFYQHSYIHQYSATYSFFLWPLLTGFGLHWIWEYVDKKLLNEIQNRVIKVIIIFLALAPISYSYLSSYLYDYSFYMFNFIKNLL